MRAKLLQTFVLTVATGLAGCGTENDLPSPGGATGLGGGSAHLGGRSSVGGSAGMGGAPQFAGATGTGGNVSTGGAPSTAGTGSGNSATGGAATGGAATGGAATGGAATGGTASGGKSATGGAATGGTASGGKSATGGAATGGTASGGKSATGGATTGGTASGGKSATGGAATGGTAGGGKSGTGGASAGGTGSGCTEADKTIGSNQIGSHCGYTYEYWKDAGTGSLTVTSDGFSASWSGINNLLGRKGLRPGSTNQLVTYEADYQPNGNSYLCVYGWTTNPLIEYYIVDSWGTFRPPGGTSLGSVSSDGGTYQLYRTERVSQPSIEGTRTFYQYWSVRTQKRTSGTITVANHFSAWASNGLSMGSLYEVSMTVEGYQSSGTANVTMSMR